jgi:hypothetical protein
MAEFLIQFSFVSKTDEQNPHATAAVTHHEQVSPRLPRATLSTPQETFRNMHRDRKYDTAKTMPRKQNAPPPPPPLLLCHDNPSFHEFPQMRITAFPVTTLDDNDDTHDHYRGIRQTKPELFFTGQNHNRPSNTKRRGERAVHYDHDHHLSLAQGIVDHQQQRKVLIQSIHMALKRFWQRMEETWCLYEQDGGRQHLMTHMETDRKTCQEAGKDCRRHDTTGDRAEEEEETDETDIKE